MNTSRPLVRWVPALLTLMMVHGVFLYTWSMKSSTPLAWDQAIHVKIAMDYRDNFATSSFFDLLRPKSFSYPPLYHFALIPALGFVKDLTDVGLPVNFFYLCVLIAAVFFIGSDLMGDWQGFTAAVLVGFYPNIFGLTRTTLIDLSLTAWVAVVFLCLWRSRHFSNLAWSLMFGMSLGFAMLTKWTAFEYIFFPTLISIWLALRERRWFAMLVAFVACGAVMAPWYVQNIIPVAIQLPVLSRLPPATGEEMSKWANIFWYPRTFVQQMGMPLTLLLVPGLAAVLWRPKIFPLLIWFAGTLVLFTLIRNKNIRYFAPALPAAALLSAAWLPSLKKISYGVVIIGACVFFVTYNRQTPPLVQEWRHEEIIRRIQEIHGKDAGPASVLTVVNHAFLHSTTLEISARARNIAISFHSPGHSRPFEFADFVLTKTGFLGPEGSLSNINNCIAVIQKPEPWFSETFKEVGRWPVADGGEAILYHCEPRPQKISDAGFFNLSLKELELPHIKATGVELHATPISLADTQVGRFKELSVRCDRVVYKSIEFQKVLVRLIRPQINLPLFFATQEIQLCRLGALEPHATVNADVLLSYAAEKAAWLNNPSIQFDGSRLILSGRAKGFPIDISEDIAVNNNAFESRINEIRIAGISVPLILVRVLLNQSIPLGRGMDWAYDINIAEIHGTGRTLRIGAE